MLSFLTVQKNERFCTFLFCHAENFQSNGSSWVKLGNDEAILTADDLKPLQDPNLMLDSPSSASA